MITRINRLIKDIQREPYKGIGKPEPLKHSLSGYWSRRINDEHRIVYKVMGNQIFIAQLRYHYEYWLQKYPNSMDTTQSMEKVCNDHEPVIITRKRESPVVMLSLEDYQSMEETAYLLRSPANAWHLLESIAELEAGKGTERELIEWNSLCPVKPGRIIFTGKKTINQW